jgi:hypothetical protein
MSRHQRAPFPLEQLEAVPQAVVVLLEVLLEKDPGRRFQNPPELLKAMPTITGAIDAWRKITRRNLLETPPYRFAYRNSQTAGKTCTRQDFVSQIARYGKRNFWPRGGYHFSGSCVGKEGSQRRFNRCLGWRRKVDAG